MAPAADGFSMEVLAPCRPVDHRLSLRIYFRTADSILKQANIYRREANFFQLYVLLLRYASLVSETIPQHSQFRVMNPTDRAHLRRRLLEAMQELESLKPGIQTHIQQKNSISHQENLPSLQINGYQSTLQPPKIEQSSLFTRLPTPSAESIARHSFLGFTSATRPLEPLKVQYPSLYDAAVPIETERVKQDVVDVFGDEVDDPPPPEQPPSQFDLLNQLVPPPPEQPPSQFDLLNQLVPPPLPAPVQKLDAADFTVDAVQSEDPRHLHISAKMMDEFMRMAKSNTQKSIETCGVLAGSLQGGKFFVTTLIIPKQEATANTCETIDEEEIFLTQDQRGLFQLGWIHTHPTQSCFMSSVDIHTHYSYQVMLQESIAIVMAPQDQSRNYGIFRLSDPGGMSVIQTCSKRGFHGHDNTSDGSPIYEQCSHVYLDSKVDFDVIDLR